MATTLTTKFFAAIYLAFLSSGMLLQIDNFREAIDADEMTDNQYFIISVIGGLIWIVKFSVDIHHKIKKNQLSRYEKKKEIDNRYNKKWKIQT